MDAHRLAQLLDAWHMRASVAVNGGPMLDAATEVQAALQALDALHNTPKQTVDEE